MKNAQNGFTLIELMIVVAIIGILASLALSSYSSYTIRAQVSEGLNLTGPAKMAVADFYSNFGDYPADNDEAAIEPPAAYVGKFVESITVDGDTIDVLFGNDANTAINGRTVSLIATTNQGSVTWECQGDGVIANFHLPGVCR